MKSGLNNNYLLKKWIFPIIAVIILLALLPICIETGSYSILFGIVIGVIIVFYSRKKTSNHIAAALKQRTSDRLIEGLVKPLQGVKDLQVKETFIAYNSAISHILFEEFEKAEKVMNKVDWNLKIPMYQATSLNIQAFIQYFEKENYNEGLSLARKAKAQAMVSGRFPGSKTADMTYEAYVEIGQLLVGFNNEEIIASLEQKFEKLPILPKLFIAYVLKKEYKRRGHNNKFSKVEAFLKDTAPYCTLLFK